MSWVTTGDNVRIGELAARTGVSVRALRYYEEQELLLPHRTLGGHRSFGEDAVARVELIQLLLSAGVPSRRIVGILPCLASGTTTPEMVDSLEAERVRISRQIAELTVTESRLTAIVADGRRRLVTQAAQPA